MKDNKKSVQTSGWFFPVLCLILAAGLVYVSYQNISLKKQIADLVEEHDHAIMPPKAASGTVAPPFAALLPDGQQIAMRTDSLAAPLVLAWLSWDCEPCIEAVDGWNDLFDYYPGQVWGIARLPEGNEDSAWVGRDIHFAIINPVADSTYRLYDVSATPQTMIVNADGTIGDVWIGPLTQKTQDSIVSILRQPFVERR
jgi:hypothetical protein